MSITLKVKIDNLQKDYVFTPTDMFLIQILSDSSKDAESIRIAFGTGTTPESETVDRKVFVRSLKNVLKLFQNDLDKLPYSYTFLCEDDDDHRSAGTGIGGIMINDKIYHLTGGVGKCDLQEIGLNPDGTGRVINSTDVRGQTALQTDNMGKIRILKRKKNTQFEKHLSDLISIAENSSCISVERFVS